MKSNTSLLAKFAKVDNPATKYGDIVRKKKEQKKPAREEISAAPSPTKIREGDSPTKKSERKSLSNSLPNLLDAIDTEQREIECPSHNLDPSKFCFVTQNRFSENYTLKCTKIEQATSLNKPFAGLDDDEITPTAITVRFFDFKLTGRSLRVNLLLLLVLMLESISITMMKS